MSDELKPCPYCGGDDWSDIREESSDLHWQLCIECGSTGPVGDSLEDAAAAVNRRALPDREAVRESIMVTVWDFAVGSRLDPSFKVAKAGQSLQGVTAEILALLEGKL